MKLYIDMKYCRKIKINFDAKITQKNEVNLLIKN